MKPRRDLFFVRKYTKPEKIGSIYVNPAWQVDNSRSLWEVIEEIRLETFGITLQPDWIVVTAPNRGTYMDKVDGVEIYALSKAEIVKVIPWTTDEDFPIAPDRVLIDPLEEETTFISVDRPRATKGRVMETGADIREVDSGDVVHYTPYAGIEIEVAGKLLMLMTEDEILWRENG
jgi:co-chaperonin GroES (HSP10)